MNIFFDNMNMDLNAVMKNADKFFGGNYNIKINVIKDEPKNLSFKSWLKWYNS